jgi:hypothetical protein
MTSLWIERDGVVERRQGAATALTAAPGLMTPLTRALDFERRA